MERSYAAIGLTLAICVMAIPAAYLMGQRSAFELAERQYQDALARAREAELESAASEPAHDVPEASSAVMRIAQLDGSSPAPPALDANRATRSSPPSETLSQDASPVPLPDAPETAGAETISPPPIPKFAFDAAAMGTTYEQVVREFGREGEPMMTFEDGKGIVTTQYVWNWLDTDGNAARIQMRFVDRRLIDKSISD